MQVNSPKHEVLPADRRFRRRKQDSGGSIPFGKARLQGARGGFLEHHNVRGQFLTILKIFLCST